MALEQRKQDKKEEQAHKGPAWSNISFAPQAAVVTAVGECQYCGATYSSTAQICPQCGMSVVADVCTFCGDVMPAGADVCPHCGNPTSGLECRECGTINFRNFCRKCGTALNGRGLLALERFKADPKYKEAEQKAIELQRLQDYIEGKAETVEFEPESSQATEETLDTTALTDMPDAYAALFTAKPQFQPQPQNDTESQPAARKTQPKIQHSPVQAKPKTQRLSVKDAIKLYEEKKAEMDAILDSIVPPPELTPEEQRDFCSARQIVVRYTRTVTHTTTKRYWICNYCGFRHGAPPECAEPWHGGRWITETNTQTETITTKSLETLD